MNKTKEKYESLLLLNYKLCSSPENEIKGVCNQIIEIFDYIKTYNLFPVDLPDSFQEGLSHICDEYSNDLRILIAKELYVYLAKTMFEFSVINTGVIGVYNGILEVIRTEFSYELANNCVEDYINCSGFDKTLFKSLFHVRKLTEKEFQTYKNKLREKPFDNQNAFPQERLIPKPFLSLINRSINDSISKYNQYIDDNYLSIRKGFRYYNKEIRIYVHEHSNESYTLTINCYENTDTKIIVYPCFVDTMYRFSNIEEISIKPSFSILMRFSPENPSFGSFFSIREIHYDLNRLFVRYAPNDDLRDYLVYLLRGELKRVSIVNETEITLEKNHCSLLFSNIPTIDDLQILIKNESNSHEQFSFVFRFRPSDDVSDLLEEEGVSYIDVERKGRLMINNENGEMVHWFIKNRLDRVLLDESYKERPVGERLIDQLKHCPKGKAGWKQYEDIGTDIFKFLFESSFRNYTFDYQSSTLGGIQRRDLIINNTFKDSNSFWGLVKNDYNSNIIIIDFKNYNKALNCDEFYKPTKYTNLMTGNFVIVFSRLGLDKNAKVFQLELLNKKLLILCFSDDDLVTMITQKMNGQDPLNSLEDKFYTLCKSK